MIWQLEGDGPEAPASGLQTDVLRLTPSPVPVVHSWPLHVPLLRLGKYLPLLLPTPNTQWLPLCPSLTQSPALAGAG